VPKRRVRRVLTIIVVGFLVMAGGLVAVGAWVWTSARVNTIGEVEFTNPLAIPPLAPSHVDEQGRRVFDLEARPGRHNFTNGEGEGAPTWGFNGDYLGPTLRAARGEEVVINVHNGLGEHTTVHWHGMHLPPAMDGGPHQQIAPGETWSPTWTIDQPAATLWYHPHLHGETLRHVYRGLAGMFILDDEESSALNLPREYGVDDLPVIVQDKKFTDNGELNEDGGFFASLGVLGDTIAVNGVVGAYQEVETTQVRLRLLNGSVGRVFNFGFSDDRSFALIGTDGGLLTAPYELNRIQLSPGERAEIVVTMEPGERVTLRSYPPDLGNGLSDRFAGGDDSFDVLQLRAADRLRDSPPLPDRLVEIPRLDPDEAVTERQFQFSGHSINNTRMDMGRIDEVVELDTTEIWEVHAIDGTPHSFHVHDVQFQVLSVDGQAPPPELSGWKDTIYLHGRQVYRIIMRFTDYADPNMPYMYHCHILYHEDNGMMGQFVVVEPGQEVGTPPVSDHAHRHGG